MGITYAAGSAFVEEHRGLWFLGFDCMHERDFIPAFVQLAKAYNLKSVNTDVANYKTFDWVRAKVEELAAQLASEG
jgi:hypothetical protein